MKESKEFECRDLGRTIGAGDGQRTVWPNWRGGGSARSATGLFLFWQTTWSVYRPPCSQSVAYRRACEPVVLASLCLSVLLHYCSSSKDTPQAPSFDTRESIFLIHSSRQNRNFFKLRAVFGFELVFVKQSMAYRQYFKQC